MPLTRNKQLALYALLATRSAYRAMLEGVPPKGSDADDNPPASADEMLKRFRGIALPGFTDEDLATLTDPKGPLSQIFIGPTTEAPQKRNISTDPEVIAAGLGIVYDPTDPDCPGFTEGHTISELLTTNLGEQQPSDERPPLQAVAAGA